MRHFNRINIVFGAGANGIKAVKALKEFGVTIDYFADNDPQKWGKRIEEIEIISAEKLREMSLSSKIRVIVSVSSSHEPEIREQLKNYKIEYYAVPQWIVMHTFDEFVFSEDNIKKIERLKSFLNDDLSVQIVECIFKLRIKQDCSDILMVYSYPATQYVEKEIINYQTIQTVVDAGAFDGDSAIDFLEKMPNIQRIFSFEPDPENYKKLNEKILIMNLSNKIVAVNKGLGDKNKSVNFASGYEVGSYIDEKGQDHCDIVCMDTFFRSGEKIDFIKMDIEGFEKEALEGARETIKRDRPSLAICLYHKPADLWEIPLMIHEMVPEYKLYIRHYSKGLTETVLYATI